MDNNLYTKVILEQQLLRPRKTSNRSTQNVIQKLAYIQIDSLNIVNRAHHHTLWNRVDNYRLDDLNTLTLEKKIFEYWFHAASYLPIEDYKYALVKMNAIKNDPKYYVHKNVEKKDVLYVLEKIKAEGALKARDFKSNAKDKGTWWNWKPYKNALEKLFMQGDLMAYKRDGIEKVYDLKSRVLPDGLETKEATSSEYAYYLIETALKAHGVATLSQMLYLRGNASLKKEVQKVLEQKVLQGSIEKHGVDNKNALYCFENTLESAALSVPDYLKILSPFDNAVIHRDKLKDIFGFDYKIECYMPKDKRLFGYFCLPILFNDAFVARVDCKAFRKEGVLEIIHLHIEESMVDIELFSHLFAKEMARYASFNNCSEIVLKEVSPKKYFNNIKKGIINVRSHI